MFNTSLFWNLVFVHFLIQIFRIKLTWDYIIVLSRTESWSEAFSASLHGKLEKSKLPFHRLSQTCRSRVVANVEFSGSKAYFAEKLLKKKIN